MSARLPVGKLSAMAVTNTLHCVKCWWSTPNMHAKKCGRCGSPLFLSDGREASHVVNTAVQQARAYMAVGYDPAYAPGVVSAAPILKHRSRSEVTWVGAARSMLVLSWILGVAGLAVDLALAQSSLQAFGVTGGFVVFIGVIVSLVIGILTAIFAWLAKYPATRAVLVIYALWRLVKYATLGAYPFVAANLILNGVLAFVLIMSLLAPSPLLPGKIRLDGKNLAYAGVMLVLSISLWSWVAVLTYHESPKVLNQAQITLNS